MKMLVAVDTSVLHMMDICRKLRINRYEKIWRQVDGSIICPDFWMGENGKKLHRQKNSIVINKNKKYDTE